MYKGLDLRFEYVIRFENGKYYTGPHNYPFHAGEKFEAYSYTESGAYEKIAHMLKLGYHDEWAGATVEHI